MLSLPKENNSSVFFVSVQWVRLSPRPFFLVLILILGWGHVSLYILRFLTGHVAWRVYDYQNFAQILYSSKWPELGCPKKLYSYRNTETRNELVLILSETKRLVSVVSWNNETASFGVLVEAKLTTSDAKHCTNTVLPIFPFFRFPWFVLLYLNCVSVCFALICLFCLVDLHFGLFCFVLVPLCFGSESETKPI